MTPEEMKSTMDFILEQQAQFSVNLAKVEENLAKTQETVADLSVAQLRTNETVSRLALQVEQIAIQLEQNSRQQAHINEVVAVIADSQQHTGERLNALIDIVQGRNGR
ncbi:MAG TPA: hypothetical protein VIW80_03010 [Pyrinomonadaceae bacterium]|jgi:acetolactate synthase small subunit